MPAMSLHPELSMGNNARQYRQCSVLGARQPNPGMRIKRLLDAY